jgi:hypothetical protein
LRAITRLLNRSQALVLDRRIRVGKRAGIVHRHVAGRGRVRSHDGLRAFPRIRMAQRVEQRPIDQNRMAVLGAAHRPHDGRMRDAVAVDDRAHRRHTDERHVDQREQRGHDARPIDNTQAGEQRRELSLFVVGVLDKRGREIGPRKRGRRR